MNKLQREYAKAKAVVETIDAEIRDEERKYIAEHHIINEDGSVPVFLWYLDNEEKFDECIEEFCKGISDLEKKYQRAKKELHDAEENLISWGLSLLVTAPQNVKDTLSNAKNNYTIREKLLDLMFRLDIKTA